MPDQPPALLVSACLLGVACNHRGGSSPSTLAGELAASGRYRVIPVCPEVAGGLPTPRPAAERGADGRVRTASGDDVTDLYRRGSEHAVALARATGAVGALLKARSPSCGCAGVYDGSHTGLLDPRRRGVTAEALIEAGVAVCSEEHTGVLPWEQSAR